MKKVLNVLMACIMAAGCLAGCSKGAAPVNNQEESKKTSAYLNLESDLPVVKDGEKVHLKFAVLHTTDFGKVDDLYFWNFVKQKMNIDAEVEQVFNEVEYANLAFASNSIPDVMIGMKIDPVKQMNYGVQEKQLMPLTSYINKTYMPNLQKILDQYPEYKAMMTAVDGNIYSFGYFNDPTNPSLYSIRQVNVKWLEEAKLNMPTTLDEFTNVLRTFKKRNDKVVPLGGSFNYDNPSTIILNAFGYRTYQNTIIEPALRNGKVVIPGGDREAFGKYVEYMNTLYKEGLISKDFFTLDQATTRSLVAERRVGVTAQLPFISLSDSKDFQQYVTMKPLTSEYSKEPFVVTNSSISTGGFVVSSGCKNPDVAIRFANYLYSDEGSNLSWIGAVRGSSNIMDGWGGWYLDEKYNRNDVDRDKDPKKWANAVEYLRKRVAGFNTGCIGQNLNENTWRPEVNGLKPRNMRDVYEANKNNGDQWYRISVLDNLAPYKTSGYPSIVFFSKKDSDRITQLKTVVETYINDQYAKFVVGARPLSEINKYFDELDKMGFQEYLGFYKDAYDKYQKNMK